MRASSLLVGLAALYTASAVPTKVVPENQLARRVETAAPSLPNLPKAEDESKEGCLNPISYGHTLSVGQSCLDEIRSKGEGLSGKKKGSVQVVCSSGDSEVNIERKGGDSSWSDVACGLEWILNTCQVPDASGDPKVAGCHEACGSKDYVICVNNRFDPFS